MDLLSYGIGYNNGIQEGETTIIGGGYELNNCTNISAVIGETTTTITWSDATDTQAPDGTVLAVWKGTKLVKKVGGYPADENDGEVLVDNTVRDAYKTTGYVDSGFVGGLKYYYALFPYPVEGRPTRNSLNRVIAIPPNNVTNIYFLGGNSSVAIKWTDSVDLTWGGTRLVRKAGSPPSSPFDGVLVVDNVVRNKYANVAFVDTGLINYENYYYQLFPYSIRSENYNTNIANRFEAMPTAYKTYGITINTSNSNPSTATGAYTDDAIGIDVGNTLWDDIFGIKPCLFKNGSVIGYLNPNDFTKFENGTIADITSGNAGDVMIEFPRRGISISTSGATITIKLTDDPNNENFNYNAFKRGNDNKEKIYIGAYAGSLVSGKYRSLSGKGYSEASISTMSQSRTNVQSLGVGYDMFAFPQLTYLQSLYLLKYKNLNSQSVIGMGNTISGSPKNSGYSNNRGMTYGENTGNYQMKLFGLEDLWGNAYQLIDGIFVDSGRKVWVGTTSFNNDGVGYIDTGITYPANLSGYLSQVQGSNLGGFLPKATSGSSTTYYCDFADINPSALAYFGGNSSVEYFAGIFDIRFYTDRTNGAMGFPRVMYL